MTWKIVKASETGTSHIRQNRNSQDYCRVANFAGPSREDVLIAVVADGAGTALLAREAAVNACFHMHDQVKAWLRYNRSSSITEDRVRSWALATKRMVKYKSIKLGFSERDAACTMLGAVISDENAAFFQIGDGAIVIGCDNDYKIVFQLQSYEYVNMTTFLSDDDALDHLRISLLTEPVADVALFTDGLQRLAIEYKTNRVHAPFFSPMFEQMKHATSVQCDQLSSELAAYLNSAVIREQTDDDLTLVLATRAAR